MREIPQCQDPEQLVEEETIQYRRWMKIISVTSLVLQMFILIYLLFRN